MDPVRPEGGKYEDDELPGVEPTALPEPPEWEWRREKPEEQRKQVRFQADGRYPRSMGLALAIGSAFVGPVLGGVLIGGLIDRRVGGPYMLVGLLLGTVAAFALLIRLVNKLNENDKQRPG